jgi:polyketide biosynthesis acyl carrier protein
MDKSETLELLVELVREVLPELADRPIGPSDSLADLGANSLDRADIVTMALERMNLDIPLVETVGPDDLGALAALLTEKSAVAGQV